MEEILNLYRELRGLFGENELVVEFHQQIHRIIQGAIDQIPDNDRVAIRPAGGDTEKLLRLYDFSKKNIIGIVDREDYGDDFCGYPCFTTDFFSTESCDRVIVSSFYYRQAIKEELEGLHIPYIDIYDELEKQGIQLQLPYPDYERDANLRVNYFYLRWLHSKVGKQREASLRELLQIAVEYKDFALISSIYQECGGENGEYPLLKTVWKKVEHLLNCLREKIQERKQKDIILFWTDSVPHEMLHYLPGIMELSKQGTFFQRAYPNTPFTNPTMRAIFCNMLPIDDFPQNQERIARGNSPLIQFMESEGYKVRVIGGSKRTMEEEYLFRATEPTCNIKWWEGIADLLQSSEPCFYIFDFLESHSPNYVPDLKEPVNFFRVARTQKEVQTRASFEYLDQCLTLYHKLLGNKRQVYFSDHGKQFLEDIPWLERPLHSYCLAVGENIPKITVTRFFPYRNFEKFVRWLVDPEHFSLDDVCADEVIFQDVDAYNPKYIDQLIQANKAKKGISYRGILNYNYKYVINALGKEFFYQMQKDGTEKLIPLEDPELRAELRNKAGTKFLDIDKYDKFRHTRKLYDFIEQNGK